MMSTHLKPMRWGPRQREEHPKERLKAAAAGYPREHRTAAAEARRRGTWKEQAQRGQDLKDDRRAPHWAGPGASR